MGFSEFGQSIIGMVLFGILFLVGFGGFTNQQIFEEYLPEGVTGPNDVNNFSTGITVNTGTEPFVTTTSSNPTQDNNPILNFVLKDIPRFLGTIAKIAASTVDALTYIGLPREIIYIFAAFIAAIMSFFAIYFGGTLILGFFRGS